MTGILDVLLDYQLRTFAHNYVGASREVFIDQASGALIHPGEFGGLRESLVRNLLQHFLPESFGVSEGFVIAPNGDVSAQCDVVVYSRQHCPIIQTAERQRFFPVEAVVAVGEVKSNADSTVLRDALEKLVKVKQMRAELENAAIAWTVHKDIGAYRPRNLLLDQLGTFIIAESISCTEKTVAQLVKGAATGQDPTVQVNMIVNIKDYCTLYRDNKQRLWMYPVDVDLQSREIIPTALSLVFAKKSLDRPQHLKTFLRHLGLIVERTTILYTDFLTYLGGLPELTYTDEVDL
jgi:hypothetical protein